MTRGVGLIRGKNMAVFLRVANISYLFGGRSILIHKKIMRVPRTRLSHGFGTTLIEQSAKSEGSSAQMPCEAQGITWEITLPLGLEF